MNRERRSGASAVLGGSDSNVCFSASYFLDVIAECGVSCENNQLCAPEQPREQKETGQWCEILVKLEKSWDLWEHAAWVSTYLRVWVGIPFPAGALILICFLFVSCLLPTQ